MGRRARTNNSSPVDCVMEKYHSDIGNRLSGLDFVNEPNNNKSDNVSEDFCLLTLDKRHMNSLRVNQKDASKLAELAAMMTPSKPELSDDSFASSESSSAFYTPNNTMSSNNDNVISDDTTQKEKKSIVDKLARALFQRKHTCSRCQRRSRSCLPNKNFNGTEKHYMCGNCRENAYAIKNLFTGLSTLNTDSSASTDSSSVCRDDSHIQTTVIQPRTDNKDSGYDTVTSCSTLASAYSAFNTPETREKFSKTPKTADGSLQPNNAKVKRSKSMPKVYSKPKIAITDNLQQHQPQPASNEFHQLVVVNHHDLPGGVLRQVKPRHVKDYDGYLPEPCHAHHQEYDFIEHRRPLCDATNCTSLPNAHSTPVHTNSRSQGESPDSLRQSPKSCHVCGTSRKPCFRLPWEGGWLCEDCIDGML